MQDRHHIRGISEPLPDGETVLWEGAPAPRTLATRVLHIRGIGVYFLLLGAAAVLWSGGSRPEIMARLAWLAVLAAIVVGMAWGYAVLLHRTTRYTVTSARVVIQKGVAFPSVVNIPFQRIANAQTLRLKDGGGELAFELVPGARIGYTFLWPHARPWKLAQPQPMFRALPSLDEAAEAVQSAYTAFMKGAAPEPQSIPAEFRVMDDDDLVVVHNGRPGASHRPEGGPA